PSSAHSACRRLATGAKERRIQKRQGPCTSTVVPTAVTQVDVENVPEALQVSRSYTAALLLMRRRGRPVGQSFVRVREGSLDMEALTKALFSEIAPRRWKW